MDTFLKSPKTVAGAALVATGLLLLVALLTFSLNDNFQWVFSRASIVGAGCAVVLTVVGVFQTISGVEQLPPVASDRESFQRYTVGVGFALLLLATLNLLAIAGLGSSGNLQKVFPPPAAVEPSKNAPAAGALRALFSTFARPAPADASTPAVPPPAGPGQLRATAALLLTTLSMAILGALFYVANSLNTKQDHEAFSEAQFWAGLWFRLGESVLFALVCFLAIRRMSPDRDNDFWLPLWALFLGMFIKTGERLIFGLANRTFQAAEAFIAAGSSELATPPGAPTDLQASWAADSRRASLVWSGAASGAAASKYVVEFRQTPTAPWTVLGETRSAETSFTQVVDGGGTCEYRVVAKNSAGSSAPSESRKPDA